MIGLANFKLLISLTPNVIIFSSNRPESSIHVKMCPHTCFRCTPGTPSGSRGENYDRRRGTPLLPATPNPLMSCDKPTKFSLLNLVPYDMRLSQGGSRDVEKTLGTNI